MFDTKIVKNTTGPMYPQEIHEHRAPTDDSVRLLNEMEHAASRNLINKFIIDDNRVKGGVFLFQDYLEGDYVMVIRFTLNGKEYEIGTKEKAFRMSSKDAKYKLIEAMAKALLDELLLKNLDIDSSVRGM